MKGVGFLNFQRMIALFMDYCRSRQLRQKTMISYEQALKLFARWLKEEMNIEDAEQVKEPHIRAYILYLQERGKYSFCADDRSRALNHPQNRRDYRQKVSNITINNYLRNIRVFFNWLEESDCIRKSPMKKVRELPQERPPKEYLSDEEVQRLFKCIDRTHFSEYRDMLVMMLMLDAGTRLGETLSSEIEQLSIETRSLYLPADKTKGRRDRTVYFSDKTAKELRRWLQFKDRYCESPFLFPVHHSGQKVMVANYETNFAKYIRRAGIEKRISPHTLRNNFAKRCLMAGMDIYTLSRILGHSSVTVTEKAYLDILITYAGTIGDMALVDADDKYHLAPNVGKITLQGKTQTDPVFLVHLFMYSHDYIMTFASQVAQASINMEKIRSFEYYFPPVNLQHQFAAFVDQTDQQKLTIQRSLDKMEVLKKALMQKYFG